jgi:periplasmic protein TonB
MLRFTYASAHPPVQRTTATVVLCVLALHVLVIASLLLSPSTTDIDNQQSIAMEMVLAPVSNTPAKAQQQPVVATQTAAPKSTAKKAEQATPSSAPAAQSADATPAATPAQSGQAKGAPAFSLPSSEAHGLNNPKPAYPKQSRRLNEQGQVVIRVFVAADGSPQQGEIKTSSGFDRLDQEALRTVMRWRFVPGQRFGTPEAMWFNVPVNFVLE